MCFLRHTVTSRTQGSGKPFPKDVAVIGFRSSLSGLCNACQTLRSHDSYFGSFFRKRPSSEIQCLASAVLQVGAMEAVQADVRRLQTRQHMKRRRRDARTNLSHWTLQTAMLISLILVCDFSAAAEWLQRKKRRGSPLSEGMERQDVIAMLEDVFFGDRCQGVGCVGRRGRFVFAADSEEDCRAILTWVPLGAMRPQAE